MNETRIAIIHKPGSLSSRLTKWATGSTAMHIGFVTGEKFYDMNLLFRRRRWPHYPPENVALYKCPVPTAQAGGSTMANTTEESDGKR